MKQSKDALHKYLERALKEYLEGKKTQRAIIGDIQATAIRGKELATIFAGQRSRGDAEKYDVAYRECETRGWL
ncbi:MAG: hypothetical protein HYU30_00050 [Chloroflexi bacterium]|nr:hypothetical protein [Chloroflexota bacterium]